MEGDEVLALIASCIVGVRFLFLWYRNLLCITALARSIVQRLVLGGIPIGCLLLLQFVLDRWSAHEVRDDAHYDVLFMAAGAAWLAGANGLLLLFGISVRSDAIEARDPAAIAVACGALLGVTLCFAGANVGEGPTIWTTFGPAALASGAWAGLWLLVELPTDSAEAIAIDRDLATGLRLAGLLISTGLVLGRTVAGDWVSSPNTFEDFVRQGWPAGAMASAAVLMQAAWRPTPSVPRHPVFRRGILPALVLVAVAIGYVIWLGPFNGAGKEL